MFISNFLADCTAAGSMASVCLSLRLSVAKHHKRYILQQVSEQVNMKRPLGTLLYNFRLHILTPFPQTSTPKNVICLFA